MTAEATAEAGSEHGGGRLSQAIDKTAVAVLLAAILVPLVVIFANVVSRSAFNVPLLWTDEVAKISLASLAFIGGAIAYRRGHQAYIRIFIHSLGPDERAALVVFIELTVLAIAIFTGIVSWSVVVARWDELTPVLQMRSTWLSLPLTIGMALVVFTSVERLLAAPRHLLVRMGLVFCALVVIIMVSRGTWLPWFRGDNALVITLGLFFVSLLLGLPVGFALMLGTLTYLYVSGAAPIMALPQNMVDGTGHFVLLALPFFVLAGVIMDQGGISTRLVNFVHTLVGHMRGGLLQVMVVSMYLCSGLSGSDTADTAAVGSAMRKSLLRDGYNPERSAAVLAASAAMGATVPPSIAMLVLGSITTVSIASLFIAGFLPAFLIMLCLMALIAVQARRERVLPGQRAGIIEVLRAGAHAVPPLLMPVVLFVGVLFGIATPTEVSTFAVVYGLLLAIFAYKALNGVGFIRCLTDSAILSGMILFILAAGATFSWVLTIAYLPQRLVESLLAFNASESLVLVASIILLIVTGSILEGLPAMLILGPLLIPMAEQIGVNPLHYAIVILIAMGVGVFVPPIGVGFYIATAVFGTNIERTARAMLPYFLTLCVGLLLVAFFPWVTLVLPKLLNLAR
jgi:tripartite ATP-independent transporter DctM subunit